MLLSVTALIFLVSPAPADGDRPEEEGLFTAEEQGIIDKALRFEREVVRLVEKVRPSSVTIECWRNDTQPAGGGSGVIISHRGHVLTNQHVVEGAKHIWVVLHTGERVKAEVVGNDPRGDISLLKVNARGGRATDPDRANPDRLSPGELVIATGNPFFLGNDGSSVVTLGVISGLGRVSPGQYFYGDAIQHDARINPGNSGGPLWDSYGNLLGINGKIASTGVGGVLGPSSTGVSYTIPIDQIRNFFEAMLEGRAVRHGDQIFGAQVESAQDEKGEAIGVRVKDFEKGGAVAREAGVEAGDVIWKLTVRGKGRAVNSFTDYLNVMSPLAEGAKVSVHIRRGHRRLVLANVKLVTPGKGRGR
jgi:S1-C subfamily serine protease